MTPANPARLARWACLGALVTVLAAAVTTSRPGGRTIPAVSTLRERSAVSPPSASAGAAACTDDPTASLPDRSGGVGGLLLLITSSYIVLWPPPCLMRIRRRALLSALMPSREPTTAGGSIFPSTPRSLPEIPGMPESPPRRLQCSRQRRSKSMRSSTGRPSRWRRRQSSPSSTAPARTQSRPPIRRA